MSSDYVMVQKACGMKESGILFRHVLKNAMLPMITVLGMSLQSLVSGAIITEQVFAWPGIGQLAVTAVMQYDYPLIMGITMLPRFLWCSEIFWQISCMLSLIRGSAKQDVRR